MFLWVALPIVFRLLALLLSAVVIVEMWSERDKNYFVWLQIILWKWCIVISGSELCECTVCLLFVCFSSFFLGRVLFSFFTCGLYLFYLFCSFILLLFLTCLHKQTLSKCNINNKQNRTVTNSEIIYWNEKWNSVGKLISINRHHENLFFKNCYDQSKKYQHKLNACLKKKRKELTAFASKLFCSGEPCLFWQWHSSSVKNCYSGQS